MLRNLFSHLIYRASYKIFEAFGMCYLFNVCCLVTEHYTHIAKNLCIVFVCCMSTLQYNDQKFVIILTFTTWVNVVFISVDYIVVFEKGVHFIFCDIYVDLSRI